MGQSESRRTRLVPPPQILLVPDPPSTCHRLECRLCGYAVSARSETAVGAAFLDHLHALHPEVD